MLSRAAILAASDRPLTGLDVPEWGGQVFIRPLSVAQAAKITAAEEKGLANAMTVALAVVDDQGAPLFTEADVPALADRNAAVVTRIALAVMAHSRGPSPGN